MLLTRWTLAFSSASPFVFSTFKWLESWGRRTSVLEGKILLHFSRVGVNSHAGCLLVRWMHCRVFGIMLGTICCQIWVTIYHVRRPLSKACLQIWLIVGCCLSARPSWAKGSDKRQHSDVASLAIAVECSWGWDVGAQRVKVYSYRPDLLQPPQVREWARVR